MFIQNREITHPDVTLLVRNAEDELLVRYPNQTPTTVHPSARFVVAYVLGRPVGCGAMIQLDNQTGEITALYVLAAHRRAGVGRRIVQALERKATAAGLGELLLTAPICQEEHSFCESVGYQANAANGHFKKKL